MTAIAKSLPSWRTLLHRYLANRQRLAMSTQQYGAGHGAVVDSGARLYQARQGGGNTLIEDAFTDANGTLLSAHTIAPTNVPSATWLNVINSNNIQSNRVANTGYASAVSILTAGVSDCTILLDLIEAAADRNTVVGVVFRYVDINNYFSVGALTSANTFVINELTGGVLTNRASAAQTWTNGVTYALSVVLSGQVITATINGINSITYSTAVRQTATKHGVMTRALDSMKVDNFKVAA